MAKSSHESQATKQMAHSLELDFSDAEQGTEEDNSSKDSILSPRINQEQSPFNNTSSTTIHGSQSKNENDEQEGSQKENLEGWMTDWKAPVKGASKEVVSMPLQLIKGPIQQQFSRNPFQLELPPSPSSRSPPPRDSNPAATSSVSQMPISPFANTPELSQEDNLGTVLVEGTPDPGFSYTQQFDDDDDMVHAQPPDDNIDIDDIPLPTQSGSTQSQTRFWEDIARGVYHEETPATQSTQPDDNSQSNVVATEDDEWDRLVKEANFTIDVPPNKRSRYIDMLRERAKEARLARGQGMPESMRDSDIDDYAGTQVATQVATQVETQPEDSIDYRPATRRQLPAPTRTPATPPPSPPVQNSEQTQVVREEPLTPPRRQLPAPRQNVVPPSAPSLASRRMDDSEQQVSTLLKSNLKPSTEEDVTIVDVPTAPSLSLSSLDPLTSEDEDEDETPLEEQDQNGKRGMKKETSVQKMPPPPTTSVPAKKITRSAAKGKGKATVTPEPTGRGTRRTRAQSVQHDAEVVPPSFPVETPQPKKSTRAKTTQKSSTKRRGGNSTTKRRRTKYADADEESTNGDEEDTITEYADDDYNAPGTSSLKRKRVPRGTYDTIASTSIKASQTPRGGRGSKISSTDVPVFALSRADGHFFAGTLLYRDSSGGCFVEYMDKSTALLQLDQLRKQELHIGDEILFEEEMVGWAVTGIQLDKKGVLQVTALQYGTETKHTLEGIRVTIPSIISRWDDRKFDPTSSTILNIPIREKFSVKPSTAIVKPLEDQSRPEDFLREFAIVGTHINERTLRQLSSTGARNTSQWTDVLSFGEHCQGRRWRLVKNDCGKVGTNDLEGITRIFLVANAPYATPKYLMALALGVPCVSLAWLEEMANSGCIKDWSQYLLPQGYSEYLGLRTSQLVDMDWGNSPDHVHRIMDNNAPAKLFKGMNILCITEDNNYAMEAKTNLLPAIILAMGADLVEVVDDLDERSQVAADGKPLTFDFAVYLKRCLGEAPTFEGFKCRTWGWVKESLIASRLLPETMDVPPDAMDA